MVLSYKTRRKLSLLLLLIWLPLYIIVAVSITSVMNRPGIFPELLIYVGLGFLWAVPFKFVFKGVGREEPEISRTRQKSD